jgi:hypothetical protein
LSCNTKATAKDKKVNIAFAYLKLCTPIKLEHYLAIILKLVAVSFAALPYTGSKPFFKFLLFYEVAVVAPTCEIRVVETALVSDNI